jgi:bla regulator protein blaR1
MTNYLMKVFHEILYLGAIASILIVLILLMKKVFGKVLSPNWHYYIWILLLVRLLVPFTPESSLSALNLFYIAADQFSLPDSGNIAPTLNNQTNSNSAETASSVHPVIDVNTDNSGSVGNATAISPVISDKTGQPERISFTVILAYLWFSGVLLLAIYTIYINIVFAWKVRMFYKPLENPRISAILSECKRITGVKKNILLFTTKRNRTPSLYAAYHTKILLSETHLEQLSNQEIKCIFLHELSHFKRKDIAVNWVITILQIVYFFQPLVWYAFYKMHEDCEISCDAKALKYLKEEEYQGYGSTVIKLIKLFSESTFIPATAGLWKHKSNYRRRIIMISKYKKSKWTSTLLTIILVLSIGLIGLTGCKKSDAEAKDNAAAQTSSENDNTNNNAAVDTATPVPETTKAPESSDVSELNNLDMLTELIGLSKDDLISKLGKDYNTIDEGGLKFADQGIRVWFDEKGVTNQVYMDDKDIDLDGVKIGSSIDGFKDAFGDPVSDNNGNATFIYNNYYLSVYYDSDSANTYAVYLLTENPSSEDEASASDTPAGTPAASSGKEAFLGNWEINQVIAYGSVGTYAKEDAEKLIGKTMSFSADSVTCFGDDPSYIENTAKNPVYTVNDIESGDFVMNYRMTFDKLGITADSVTEVTAYDADGNGCTLLVKDDNTLIVVGGGTYFELVRKVN